MIKQKEGLLLKAQKQLEEEKLDFESTQGKIDKLEEMLGQVRVLSQTEEKRIERLQRESQLTQSALVALQKNSGGISEELVILSQELLRKQSDLA